jgi:hypothetical protein
VFFGALVVESFLIWRFQFSAFYFDVPSSVVRGLFEFVLSAFKISNCDLVISVFSCQNFSFYFVGLVVKPVSVFSFQHDSVSAFVSMSWCLRALVVESFLNFSVLSFKFQHLSRCLNVLVPWWLKVF